MYYFGTILRKPLLAHRFLGRPLGGVELGASMRKADSDYYAARLNEEWRAAKNADCPAARAAHEAMADLYAERLVRSLEPRPTLRIIAAE